MDGEKRIMISEALNESDRLSSCNKRARKAMEPLGSPFHVYAFQTVSDADAGEAAEDFVMAFNLGGIRLSPAAFEKLRAEISLEPLELQLPELWGSEGFRLYRGLVGVDNDIFRKIVLRKSRVAQIDARDFKLQKWTEKSYYEVLHRSGHIQRSGRRQSRRRWPLVAFTARDTLFLPARKGRREPPVGLRAVRL